MVNDYPYEEESGSNPYPANEFEESKGNGLLKRKLSDDMLSEENEEQQYSPPTSQSAGQGKKLKRCRFWPDCHSGEQCEFVHPTQRCT